MLDVNVLVALAWPNHVHHVLARRWFDRHHREGWATTPVTELGFVRVSSNRSAIAGATTPAIAMELLRRLVSRAGHEFWVDDLRLVAPEGPSELISSHREVTDTHLLCLAERWGGRLVTFDAGIARLLGDRDPASLDVQSAGRT